MAYIRSISIDGNNVTKNLLQHAKLIKIIISDKILVDHLFLVINKEHDKGTSIKEGSIIKFVIRAPGKGPPDIISFYFYKDDNASNRGHLTEAEKALAKDPNNVIFHGLSVRSGFTEFYEDAIKIMTSPPAHVFKNQTLTEVLEYLQQALGLDELVVNHKKINTKVSYLKVNKVQLKPDGSYTKTIMEELADIFYATAAIRDNKLYFFQKRYLGQKRLFNTNLSLFNSSVIDISNVKGMNNNQPPYKGVSFSYFEGTEANIKQKSLGDPPFLKLDNVYEKDLAKIYAASKLKEINEPQILKLTVKDIKNRMPGCYLWLRRVKEEEPLEKRVADIIGGYTVKECIITYGNSEQHHQDPNKAGPSAKKPKLEPFWSTTLHLIKLLPGLNQI